MIPGPNHGPVSVMRDIILREIERGFSEHIGMTVHGAHWFWDTPDGQASVIVHQRPVFSDPEDPASACARPARFEAFFVAGRPGVDTTGPMADWWVDYVLRNPTLDRCADDELWEQCGQQLPRFGEIGGFRVYELGTRQVWASAVEVRSEIHISQES